MSVRDEKNTSIIFLGFGTQVAFLLLVGLESAAKHNMILQCLKSNNHVDLEINTPKYQKSYKRGIIFFSMG